MQKIIIYLILFIPVISFSQYWAPIGATWHYEQSDFTPPFLDDLIIYESIGDTVINGDSTKVINQTFMKINSTTGDTNISQEIIYEKFDSNRVYFYYQPINDFRLLYDFNAMVGDSFPVFCRQSGMDSSVTVIVDSISSIIIGTETLKVQYVSSNDFNNICQIGGTIIERIGWTGYMFPQHSFVDPPGGGPLRCYEDPIIGLYQYNTSISCDYITSVEDNSIALSGFELYPNPSNGIFTLETTNLVNTTLNIYNIAGQLVLQKTVTQHTTKINLTPQPKGLYLLKIIHKNQVITKRIIKY